MTDDSSTSAIASKWAEEASNAPGDPAGLQAILDAEESEERKTALVNSIVDSANRTALHWAACSKNLDTVKWLVQQHADVAAKTFEGTTPLQYASMGGDKELLQYLVEEAKAPLESADAYGWTPLHTAVMNGNHAAVAYLLSAGANRDAQTTDRLAWVRIDAGCTPKDIARLHDKPDIVALFEQQ